MTTFLAKLLLVKIAMATTYNCRQNKLTSLVWHEHQQHYQLGHDHHASSCQSGALSSQFCRVLDTVDVITEFFQFELTHVNKVKGILCSYN